MGTKDITLREGLQKFYQEYDSHLSHKKEGLPDDVKSFFLSHDITHVLFGCDISLYGEGSVKIWTIFGTTLGFLNHIRAYKKANAYELARNFTFIHAIANIFKLFIAIPSLIIRAKQMYKPWPWTGFEDYLDVPISKIRTEFNIRVLS